MLPALTVKGLALERRLQRGAAGDAYNRCAAEAAAARALGAALQLRNLLPAGWLQKRKDQWGSDVSTTLAAAWVTMNASIG